MKGALPLIFILILACAVAWSYLTPIDKGVDFRNPDYYLEGLGQDQEWTTYGVSEALDLERVSLEKQARVEDERRRRALSQELERERGTRIERITQDWNGHLGR